MSGAVESEPPRGRPLSGGLWTLFSWLRRDEHASSDSLSSAGSDRTAASFAFLAPAHYGLAAPAPRPPPPPPTDSYKKRVRDRNQRRQHERDLTLHRKYGLYGFGYTLPTARRGEGSERERRAASESPRAHVPGKRRAPLPPLAAAATSSGRRARKRPAPPPPVDHIKESVANDATNIANNGPMNRQPLRDKQPPQNYDNAMGCKPEKYSKKDAQTKETKDVKIRHEKSFLKHIFDNRKRNSAIETTSVKLLPNISELDKQAAEMIEKYRLKEMAHSDVLDKELGTNETPGSSKQQTETWICTRCLRKYNSSVITCNYCLPLNKGNDSYKSSKLSNNYTQTKDNANNIASGSSSGVAPTLEDKEKLKEMLKEMKDSLPKKTKNDLRMETQEHRNVRGIERQQLPNPVEAPTLRIGSSICTTKHSTPTTTASYFTKDTSSQLPLHDIDTPNKNAMSSINSVVVTQPVVLVHTQSNIVVNENNVNKSGKSLSSNTDAAKKCDNPNVAPKVCPPKVEKSAPTANPQLSNNVSKTKYDLNTPLKISSLLNPIYVPKDMSTNTKSKLVKQTEHKNVSTTSELPANSAPNVVNAVTKSSLQINPMILNTPSKEEKQISEPKKFPASKETASNEKSALVKTDDEKVKNTNLKNSKGLASPISIDEMSRSNDVRVDPHARRRDLIHQLERSIAKGDENAAAEAAVKLAQLRLSCSVLSFSSQIVGELPNSSAPIVQRVSVLKSDNEDKSRNVENMIQTSAQTNVKNIEATPTKQLAETLPTQNININNTEEPVNSELPKLESAANVKLNNEKEDIEKPCTSKASGSKYVVPKKENDDEIVPILIWVEDKEATRGPVQLHVKRSAVLGHLRTQAEHSLGLAAHLQRWIVGRTLCTDDSTPLVILAGAELSAPFYLCLVESDCKTVPKPQVVSEDPGNVYNELVKLEKQALVSNAEHFECGVCIEECPTGAGVVLRECVHSFCKECLSDVVRHSEEPVVSCPAMGCRGFLQEREIRALVSSDDYEKWLARGLAAAESGTRNAFHCRTRDCTGWALCDPGVRRFPCPVCKCTNCVPCQAIHEGETCDQYRAKIQDTASGSDASQTDAGTRALLNTLISRGEALECPECSAIITKKWGCDWVKCSACKTEICWVTKGRRWGPAGRGDTTGGCRCGVDGKRCHPSCGYCH